MALDNNDNQDDNNDNLTRLFRIPQNLFIQQDTKMEASKQIPSLDSCDIQKPNYHKDNLHRNCQSCSVYLELLTFLKIITRFERGERDRKCVKELFSCEKTIATM